MKFNSGFAMLGLFVAAVIGGGALLLSQPEEPARALTPQSASAPAKVAKAEPAPPPRDERFVIKRILPINGPIKYGEWH